jgi:DNA polymerase-3 subunit chi
VEGIARLLLRRGRLTPNVLLLCPDAAMMQELNERLWTVHPESFLAHAVAGADAEANARQPILLASDIVRDNDPQVLINGGLEVPTDVSGFGSIVDFVDAWDDGLLAASRERFKTYKRLGLEPEYLGVAAKR